MPKIRLPHDSSSDMHKERVTSVNDIFDWLSSIFGFQVRCTFSSIFCNLFSYFTAKMLLLGLLFVSSEVICMLASRSLSCLKDSQTWTLGPLGLSSLLFIYFILLFLLRIVGSIVPYEARWILYGNGKITKKVMKKLTHLLLMLVEKTQNVSIWT